jgi:hypothetical protein
LVTPVVAGTGFTDTVVIKLTGVVQPLPVPAMVSVYTVVAVGVAVVFCVVVVDRLAPAHVQLVVELLVLPPRFTVPPTHIGPSLVRPDVVGTSFTVTVVIYTVAFPQPDPVPVMVSE